jgi:phospholipase C
LWVGEGVVDIERIEHVVVVMLENRSFDHVLGALALEGREVDGVDTTRFNCDLANNRCHVAPMASHRTSSFVPGPPHDPVSVTEQTRDMEGFVRAYQRRYPDADDLEPGEIMHFLERRHQPMTYFLADHFAICDRWFSAVPTDTIPNRLYSLAGDSGGVKTTAPRLAMLGIPKLESIFEHMKPDDWMVFSGSIPLVFAVSPVRTLIAESQRWHTLSTFHTKVGKLPKLTWIEPTYYWIKAMWGLLRHTHTDQIFRSPCDDHPPSHTEHGQALLRYIYESLVAHPDVWARTVLVVTYDEHGGFYDHVQPPPLSYVGDDGFTHRGPRVPAVIASPFAAAGSRCRADLDHCSTLKFLCEWLGIRPWTERIRAPEIASIAAALTDTARADLPRPTYDEAAVTPSPRGHRHASKLPSLVADLHRVTYEHHRRAYEGVFPHARPTWWMRLKWMFG